MNTHTTARDCPPAISAGPRLLAGFTEVPVRPIPRMCTSVSVRPITRPATDPFSTFEVTPRMAKMKMNVRTTSITSDLAMLPSKRPLHPSPDSLPMMAAITTAATIAPIT